MKTTPTTGTKYLSVKCAYFGAQIDNSFKLGKRTLLPLKGDGGGFFEEAKKVTRPYIEISEAQYIELESRDEQYYLLKDGRVVTWGNPDGGFALMPLQRAYTIELLAKNSIFF